MLTPYIKEPIIDLACGTGYLVKELSKHFNDIYANDFSTIMTSHLNNRKVTNDDAETLSSYNIKFNTLICCNLFYYIQNRDKTIRRWKSLLEDEGILLFIEEQPFMYSDEFDLKDLVKPISLYDLEELLIRHNLNKEHVCKTPIDDRHDLYGIVFRKKFSDNSRKFSTSHTGQSSIKDFNQSKFLVNHEL